jgi:hypothetical protein
VRAFRTWLSTSAAALRRPGLADHTAGRAIPIKDKQDQRRYCAAEDHMKPQPAMLDLAKDLVVDWIVIKTVVVVIA